GPARAAVDQFLIGAERDDVRMPERAGGRIVDRPDAGSEPFEPVEDRLRCRRIGDRKGRVFVHGSLRKHASVAARPMTGGRPAADPARRPSAWAQTDRAARIPRPMSPAGPVQAPERRQARARAAVQAARQVQAVVPRAAPC
ncbi:hypothetical protein chiPu_0029872, partial [Chiloscyllium punctatum]|nr:hypothetical protein [Chiloscyllium punctatum]